MRARTLSVTQERINAQRVLHNLSFEQLAEAVDIPVYRIKRFCGYRLTFSEWLSSLFAKGGE